MADLVIVELCTLIDDSSLDSKIREDLDSLNGDTWNYNDTFGCQFMVIAAIQNGVASLWQGDWEHNGKFFNALDDAGRIILSKEEFDDNISKGCMKPCGETIKVGSHYEC